MPARPSASTTPPGGFPLDSARRSRPLAPDTDASEQLLAAAEGCPAEAIVITLADSGEAVFPPEEQVPLVVWRGSHGRHVTGERPASSRE
ncbi:hypothetical protein SUDANB178_05096 [Streptomyces sp. enrichment culture]